MLSTQEIRQLQTKELHDELARSTRELIQVRMDIVTGTSKESHRLTELKKHIARIKTIMNQQPKEVAAPKEEVKSEVKPKKVVKATTRKAAKAVTKAKAAVKKATKSTKK
ncbi:50S ribosomal protein L29 [Candidatus Peregrinibacteria bacterium]|nr:50S ribosomal protein L29 [Candidatus Peregrinibacteria bacterium]